MPAQNRRRLLLAGASLLLACPAATRLSATPAMPAIEQVVGDDEPGAGTLMLTGPGVATALPAVRLGTDMDVTVTGPVARTRVTQAFRNGSSKWMEARYLFPLPQDGAVDGLKMVVGNRVIVGRIERRAAAQALYDQAKAKGQKAGLVEEHRPNMFTTHVANIAPGETVLVSIEYQAPVAQANGGYALRLPLVVAPRYAPPHSLVSTLAVADARAVTSAPLMDPRTGAALNTTSITVHLRPGFVPANLVSRYHRVAVTGTGADRTVRLAGSEVAADRDFELDWRPASAAPSVGLFRERAADGDYLMAAITPPADLAHVPAPPRTMIFVIDNSGSMGGASMAEAKASLVHALRTLRPQDRFNVIRFDDTMTQLFARNVPATPDQVAAAVGFAEGLEANGGTEMLPALRAALADANGDRDPAQLRQVVFLTDGAISNEAEMLATLARDGGAAHVFLVGIGSAPNDHLMARMAAIGRGTYTHVGTAEEVAARMMPLLDMLAHPAMQDVTAKVEGGRVDLTPRRLPDLYAGEPLVLLGKADRLSGTLVVSGTIAGRAWEQHLDLAGAQASPAVAKLWARRRIDDIEADRALGTLGGDAADAQVAAVGLASGLVTSQTSLVAVDATPARPAGEPLRAEDLPLNLPAGWDFATLFGGAHGQHAVASGESLDQPTALDLPQTATGFAATILEGLLLLLVGLAGLVVRSRRLRRS